MEYYFHLIRSWKLFSICLNLIIEFCYSFGMQMVGFFKKLNGIFELFILLLIKTWHQLLVKTDIWNNL